MRFPGKIENLIFAQTTPKAWLFGWFGVDTRQIRYSPPAFGTGKKKDVARVTLENPPGTGERGGPGNGFLLPGSEG